MSTDIFNYEIRVFEVMPPMNLRKHPFRKEVFTLNQSMRIENMRAIVKRLRVGFPVTDAYEVEVGIRESNYTVLEGV